MEDDLAYEILEFPGKTIISITIYKFNEEFILGTNLYIFELKIHGSWGKKSRSG